MGDLLADIEGGFIVQQLHQFFHDDLLAQHDGGRAFVGAEVGQHPARVLAEDRVGAHHKLEDAVQEVALQQGVRIVLHFFAQHVAEDPQGQAFYLQVLGFQALQQAIHHFLLIEEPRDRFVAGGVGKLIKGPKGDHRPLDDEGKQRLIGDLITENMVEQHPNIRDVSFCNGQDILFLTDYVISGCDQGHGMDVS